MRKGFLILLLLLALITTTFGQQPVTAQDTGPTPAPTIPPGQPVLIARNFTASPDTTVPGGRVSLTLEVANVGTRIAQGVSIAVDAGDKAVPASGQSSVTLPDIGPGTYQVAFMDVTIAKNVPPGPISLPLTISYYDFESKLYTTKASLGVTIRNVVESPQVTLSGYQITPEKVEPGKPVTISLTVTNTGNETAQQVLVRLSDKEAILLPGSKGNSFAVGNLAAKASKTVDLPLVVSTGAKEGPQAQSFTITYLQGDKTVETSVSITLNIQFGKALSPTLLLATYEAGTDTLKPGTKFTFSMTLKNIGDGDASDLMVTFAQVDSSSSGGNNNGTPTGDGGGGNTQTNTTPSNVFAILNTGDTLFVGDIPTGKSVTVKQDFMVSGNVDSGLYSLPITLRYKKPDGSNAQDNMRATLIVLSPPRLQIGLQSPLPPQANVGESFPVAVKVANVGKNKVQLTSASVEVENGHVIEGEQTDLTPLAVDADNSINAVVAADSEGDVTIKVVIHYTDDLNHEQQIINTYKTTAVIQPPPPTPIIVPTDVSQGQQDNDKELLTKFLLGLLGLGS